MEIGTGTCFAIRRPFEFRIWIVNILKGKLIEIYPRKLGNIENDISNLANIDMFYRHKTFILQHNSPIKPTFTLSVYYKNSNGDFFI